MNHARFTLQMQLMVLAAGSALLAAIGASLVAWTALESLNQGRVTARLDRAGEVVRDDYQNLIEDAQIIVGLYAERAALKTQLAQRDQLGLADALSTATLLRAIHFLQVTDSDGVVLARVDLGLPPSSGQNVSHLVSFQHAMLGESVDGLELDDRSRLQLTVSRPVFFRNQIVGSVQGGFFLDQRFVERMKGITGADVTLFFAGSPFASTIPRRLDPNGGPANGYPALPAGTLRMGQHAEQLVELREGAQRVRYYPLHGPDGTAIGLYAVGLPTSILEDLRLETLRYVVPFMLLLVVLASLAAAFTARHLTGPLRELVGEARRIGAGDLEAPIQVGRHRAALTEEIGALVGAMEEMRLRLRALNRSRDEYLFAVAHELKTPLASLGASAEMLATEDADMTPDERRRTIARLNRGIARVHNLVNNLLDLGSIRAGTFRVKPRPVSLFGPVNDAVASVEPLLHDKRQTVRPQIEPDAVRVLADSRRVSQVLVNLLSNASKYGAADEPILVSARRENGHVRIGVTDFGPGIPPSERATVFERYYRNALQQDTPGVGLGLAIVKAIVEAHGGEVGVADGEGRGATVWFTLPAALGEGGESL